MNDKTTRMSHPPMIILRKEDDGNQIFWRAALSLSDEQMAKTSKLALESGTAKSEEEAMNSAYESIQKMCKNAGLKSPQLKDCMVENN